jgi:translation initiation factor IF-1
MKQEEIAVEGCEVIEVLGCDRFKVKLPNDQIIIGHIAGKLRKNLIRVTLGDKVTVGFSPYDLTKGRIIFRSR